VLSAALTKVQVFGRLQLVGEEPEIWIDVGHNPQAAHSLAQWLAVHPFSGDTIAVFGGMQDKDVEGVALALAPYISFWMLAGLQSETARGLDTMQLAARLRGATRGEYQAFPNVTEALDAAIQYKVKHTSGQHRIIAFGSFFLVAGALRALGITELPATQHS
jgi:dihydrofolate synthase / folylpolyglutamate synthase